ncbi:hypothetical protein GOV09_05785 [Candidatus Woesearchaeota archaeon]|nr:hypothetical protein [Candidatus Woesearchaeota archaeon]
MSSTERLRTEKEQLQESIMKCEQYLTQLDQRLNTLTKQLENKEIDELSYTMLTSTSLGGRSFGHYIYHYEDLIKGYQERIAKIDKKVKHKNTTVISVAAIFVAIMLSSLFLNSDITGQITFSVIEALSDPIEREFNESVRVPLDNTQALNTFTMTGKYNGTGFLRIYLDSPRQSYLVYGTDDPSTFKDECGQACYLQPEDNYTLRIQLSGQGSVKIEKVTYLFSELREFTLEPEVAIHNLTDNRFIKGSFDLVSKRGRDFSVALYGEGQLADYLTLYTSYADFRSSPEQKISYDLDLPLQMAPGTYTSKIIVKYLPKDKFSGKTPEEVHDIVVNIRGREEAAEEGSYLSILFTILIALFGINLIYFLYRKLFLKK